MKDTMRAWAEIDIGALLHNFNYARALTGKQVMCVIKGDAHGHGAVRLGQVLQEHGADAFAVACLQEAIALRQGGIVKPILVLGWTPAEEASAEEEISMDDTYIRSDNVANFPTNQLVS